MVASRSVHSPRQQARIHTARSLGAAPFPLAQAETLCYSARIARALQPWCAGVVKLADTQDLGSCGLVPWGFKSLRPHHDRTLPQQANSKKLSRFMQITETLSSGLKREYRVVVPAADLDRELDSKLKELAGRAQIKGFRPGKVPVPHLRRIYGKSVMADVVQETIESSNKQLFQERSLKPAYQPQVTLPQDKAEV